jgi:hypothetical protein
MYYLARVCNHKKYSIMNKVNWLIESNSCAGEYGCDLGLIIEAGAKAAWDDYDAVNRE